MKMEYYFYELPRLREWIEKTYDIQCVPTNRPTRCRYLTEFAMIPFDEAVESGQFTSEELLTEYIIAALSENPDWVKGKVMHTWKIYLIKAIGSDKKWVDGHMVTVHNELTFRPIYGVKASYSFT